MPPRRKAKMTAQKSPEPFRYPKISRATMDHVRTASHDHPYEFSKHAESLIPTLPEDLQEAIFHDFGEAALQYPPRERKETNMNLARLIVAYSMQLQAEAAATEPPENT